MKYKMTLFIADRSINDFMEIADLKPAYKVYVSEYEVEFEKEGNIAPEFFYETIKLSKECKSMWVPAIEFCGMMYVDADVKQISNGEQCLFMRK